MSVRGEYVLYVACDTCGRTSVFTGRTKTEALGRSRRDGKWAISGRWHQQVARCPTCKGKRKIEL